MWANAVVLSWLAVAVVLLAAHEVLGLPSRVALHALLLGAVTNAILIWSEHRPRCTASRRRSTGPPPHEPRPSPRSSARSA